MAGHIYDGGGSDESGLAVAVRLDPGWRAARIVNKDGFQVWGAEVDPRYGFMTRVTGLSTFDIPLTLQTLRTIPVLPGEPLWPDQARLELPTLPRLMRLAGVPSVAGPPPLPGPPGPDEAQIAYLQALPGRTSPIHPDVLSEVGRLNDLASLALGVLAALVKAKALRDVALASAQAYGAGQQADATLLGSAMQAEATSGAALSSRAGLGSDMDPETTWADIVSIAVSGAAGVAAGAGEIAAFGEVADRLSVATRNNTAYLARVGQPDITGDVIDGVLSVGPDYFTLRAAWLREKEALFCLPNYLNPAWFTLQDLPLWTG